MQLPDFLTERPDGEIVLTGHRIELFRVVDRFNEGCPAEQIADEFPTLAADHVRQVVGFYQGNRAEVDEYVRGKRAELARLRSAGQKADLEKLRRLKDERDAARPAPAKGA